MPIIKTIYVVEENDGFGHTKIIKAYESAYDAKMELREYIKENKDGLHREIVSVLFQKLIDIELEDHPKFH